MAWMDARIAELDEEVRGARADLLASVQDPDAAEKRASLASEAVIARITGELEEKTQLYAEQIPALEACLLELFGRPRPS